MFKNMFNKKNLLSMLLAFAMVFSFVGFTDSAFAAPTTDSLEITTNDLYLETLTRTQINDMAGANRYYSALNRKGNTVYYTAKGATLLDIIQPSLTAAGKTVNDIVSVELFCSDAYYQNLTKAELFGTFNYYSSLTSTGVAVDTIIATEAANDIDVNPLSTVNTLRLFVGQTSTVDVNNYKYTSGIEAINVVTN